MRKPKTYPTTTKQIYHAELTTCPTCGTRLRRYATDPDDQRTATQVAILDDYALVAQTALNLDALQPFQYASPAVDDALAAIASSLERLKKGAPNRPI